MRVYIYIYYVLYYTVLKITTASFACFVWKKLHPKARPALDKLGSESETHFNVLGLRVAGIDDPPLDLRYGFRGNS